MVTTAPLHPQLSDRPAISLFEALDDRSDLCEGARRRINEFKVTGVGNCEFLH